MIVLKEDIISQQTFGICVCLCKHVSHNLHPMYSNVHTKSLTLILTAYGSKDPFAFKTEISTV
jgi:hypothetical protein